jgi:hypothetical protein
MTQPGEQAAGFFGRDDAGAGRNHGIGLAAVAVAACGIVAVRSTPRQTGGQQQERETRREEFHGSLPQAIDHTSNSIQARFNALAESSSM